MENQQISIETKVQAPIDKVWEYWTKPEHVINWNNASPDWHNPKAENDLRQGGSFSYRMEAKDGSAGFNFEGEYTRVDPRKHIAYTMGDGRKVEVQFKEDGNHTVVIENFEAENAHSAEMQKKGWQSILDNFRNYVEQN